MVEKDICTGCMVCVNKCPVKCVRESEDDLGFHFPNKNMSECIDCGLCTKVCHACEKLSKKGSKNAATNTNAYYAAYILDEDSRGTSSSGGIFTALANAVLDVGGVVYGASMSKDFQNVEHIRIDCKDQLTKIQGSKYISGTIDHAIYTDVEQQLGKKRTVLFSGTPCQISALKAFLMKPYDNLYLVDVLCHGVPSPKVWRKYLEYREKQACSTVVNVEFRNKRKGWKHYSLVMTFCNGREYRSIHSDDLYLTGFLSNLYLREGCFNCQYRNERTESDITLGDYWHIESAVSEWDDDRGVSWVHIQTEKGGKLYDKALPSIDSKKIDFNLAARQKTYDQNIRRNPQAASFKKDFLTMDINDVLRKYCSVPWKIRIKKKLWRILH